MFFSAKKNAKHQSTFFTTFNFQLKGLNPKQKPNTHKHDGDLDLFLGLQNKKIGLLCTNIPPFCRQTFLQPNTKKAIVFLSPLSGVARRTGYASPLKNKHHPHQHHNTNITIAFLKNRTSTVPAVHEFVRWRNPWCVKREIIEWE